MKVSRAADVAVRALVLLTQRDPKIPVSLAEIASREGLPRPYLSRVLQSLSDSGLVLIHGAGLYSLCYEPSEITLRMIVEAVDGPSGVVQTVGLSTGSSRSKNPPHPAWREVRKRMIEVLDDYTLESFALDAQYYL
jgi:Rrf2 family protein